MLKTLTQSSSFGFGGLISQLLGLTGKPSQKSHRRLNSTMVILILLHATH